MKIHEDKGRTVRKTERVKRWDYLVSKLPVFKANTARNFTPVVAFRLHHKPEIILATSYM